MEITAFERQVFFTTIRIVSTHNGEVSIGTGFIYKEDLPIDGYAVTFLVSNKHVLCNTDWKLSLNFHKKSQDDDHPQFGNSVNIERDNFIDLYYEHSDSEIDLACIDITNFTNQVDVFYKNLHKKFVEPYDVKTLSPGQQVFFIGYPENRFDLQNNLPILRSGYLATIPEVDFNGKKQFVIDAQVFPGSSGSPVFAATDGNYRLLGVVAATMIKDQKLMTIPADYKYSVQQPIGLGIVLKTELVIELLQDAANKISERVKAVLVTEGKPWKLRSG